MRAALLTSLLLSCTPPATQFEFVRPLSLERCVPTFVAEPRVHLEVLFASQPTTLDFLVEAFLECELGRREVESISVELIDDVGAPVATRVEVLGSGPSRLVKVTFTPGAGAVHLRIAAEPTIGVFSKSFRVVHSSSRSWVELPSRSCDGLVDGPSGEPLCVNGGRVEFAGRVVPADGVAVTASMVWLARSTMLEGSFSDGGTAVRVPLPSRAWAIAARGRKVAVWSVEAITTVDEAGVVHTLALQQGGFLGQGLSWWDDDTLIVSHPSGFDRVPLDGSVPNRPFAGRVPFQVMGDDGLWSIDSNDTLTLHRFDGGRAQTPGFGVPPTESFALPDRVPVLRPGLGAAPLVGIPVSAPDGGITVDVVEVPPGLSTSWLTSKWLFARHRVTRTLWMTPRVP